MSTRRALLFSFLDRYSGLVLSVIASMAIARLLPPSELGIFSVAMALLLLATTVRDLGAGQYIVQVQELTPARVRAVWTIQVGIGAVLALLTAAAAIPAARFYDEPKITGVLAVMAVGYLINPFGSITYALLMREMRFERIALMRFCAALSSALVSVTLAYRGHGVMSLAWGSLAATMVNALIAQWVRPSDTPWGLNFKGVPEVMGFSGRIAGTSVITTVVNTTPDFLLGKFQDMHAAGLYSRSNGLVAMFSRLIMDAIQGVAVSFFSQQRRDGLDLKPAFLKAMSYITVLNWVFCALLALLAFPLTGVLYGSQWDESISLTRWLALGGACAAPITLCAITCTAAGRTDLLMRATFIAGCVTAAAAIAGTIHSLDMLGRMLALASLIGSVIWLLTVRSTIGFGWRELLSVLARSGATTLLALLLPVILMAVYFQDSPFNRLLTLILLGSFSLICAPLAALLSRHPIAAEMSHVFKQAIDKAFMRKRENSK